MSCYEVTCPECGFVTEISWRHNKTKIRKCRHCGSQIEQPEDTSRYDQAPVIKFRCNHPELCLYGLTCREECDCCISCPTPEDLEEKPCPYKCQDARVWLETPGEFMLELCEDLEVVIVPREVTS